MKLRYVPGALALVAVSMVYGDLPNYHLVPAAAAGSTSDVAAGTTSAAASKPVTVPGRIASTDEQRGVPTVLWANQRLVPKAPHSDKVQAAEWYLSLFSPTYRLSRDSLRTVYIHRVHDIGRGAIAVFFRQRVGGIDVVRNEAKVVMKRDLSLVAITGNLHEAATPGTHSFARSPASALATAFGDKHNLTIPTGSVRSANRAIKAGYSYFELTPTAAMRAKSVTLTEPARVKPVLYPVRNRLVPAYYVEFFTGSLQSKQATAHGYMVAANDGAVLQRDDLTVDDSYTYRVWAEDSGRKLPLDGPQSDFTPHPTGAPDGSQPSFIPPNLVTIEGFNTNPEGGVDPWLPPGATETIGNNVDAYADLVEPDGFTDPGDIRATTTSPGTFDRVYDTAQPPNVSSDQIQAAVTQLFYTSNWLHNYFYDSGFNEAAGNAQASNFGRGGVEGDRMRVEAQDYSGVNNANMSTPGDGASPRMQMYVWSPESDANLTALDTTFTVGTAAFGPDNFELTAELSLIEDGTAPTTDGCEAIDTDLTGKIAIIDRGGCAFVVKAANAEARGAVGVVIVNNTPGAPPPGMAGTDPIGIPVLSITFEDGDTLKVAVTNGTVEATMDRLSGPVRDGTIDNAIVAHEWGHYIHFRLTSCQSTAQQCRAQSEGWGDFISLHMMVRPGDDLSGSYAMAYYSTISLGDNYFGVRRVPYTRYNPAINALTFRHVINGVPLPPHPLGSGAPDNAQVHNSGEVWASILIEGYFDMLAAAQGTNPPYTFAEAKRRMADYIVLGMQLAPVDPTFTEQLDAILAAVAATDSGDFVRLSLAYARRGVGTCAISAPRYSDTNIGAVEDFSLRGDMQLAEVTLGDAVNSCDSDGNLDGGETGQMSIDVFNPGIVAISNTTVTLSSPDLRVLFPDGPSATLSSVGSYATEQARINVALADNFTTTEDIPIVVTLNNPDTCTSTVVEETIRLVDFDIVPSTVDTVSNPEVSWAETFVGANIDVWNRVEDPTTAGNFVWHGIDAGTFTDTAIESPDLEVSPTDPLTIIFSQRYRFEADTIFWDGGVIEISSDGGATWEDISLYATPTYGGTVTDQAGNPLSNRMAYVGDSPGYPAFSNEALELGTAFAGQTVKIRFRIGTDPAVGAEGWYIDNISATGITNSPFTDVEDDDNACVGIPLADAGVDQTVDSGDMVSLDASSSSDPNGDALFFVWTQFAGPEVTLDNPTAAMPTFTAPEVSEDTIISFALTATDGVGSSQDTVDITVLMAAGGGTDGGPDGGTDGGTGEPDGGTGDTDGGAGGDDDDDDDDDDGGCCSTGESSPANSGLMTLIVAMGLAVILRRRRREQA